MDKAKENHAKIGAFVLRLFPTMMQLILKDNIPPGRLKRIFIDKTFSLILTDADIDLMKMLPNLDDFTIEICYKILRFENLIREPKCKWGNIPHETEVGIADDIQRILNFSNEVISKTSQELTTIYHESKFEDTVKQIVKRVDEYLRSDDCKKMYQHLHNQKIDTSEVLDKLTHTQHIQVVPSTLTTKMKTIMREFYSRTALVVTEIFPDILRNIIQSRISARDLYRKFDKAFYSSCWPEQQNLLKKIKHDNSFSSLDIPTTYRLLRYFSLIPPPSNGWGTDPALTDIVISDDVERIRKLRNKIAHSFDATISKSDFDTFFVRCCEIGGRIDQYFNKQTSFKQKIVDCKICLMDTEMQTKYEKAVKELENLKRKIYQKNVM